MHSPIEGSSLEGNVVQFSHVDLRPFTLLEPLELILLEQIELIYDKRWGYFQG